MRQQQPHGAPGGLGGLGDLGSLAAGATVTRLASVALHFFTQTRWDRMLHQIR